MGGAGYLRISEDRDGTELGVERQREDVTALLERRGQADAVEWFIENNQSATRGERVVWSAMMDRVERGEFEFVAGWSIDRILRTGKDRLRMLDAGRTHGIELLPVRGSSMDLGTPAGRLSADILGSVALHEVEQKSDRQRRAARQRAEQGRPWAARRPFGFETGGMELDPEEADLLRVAYGEVLAGRPLYDIAKGWNASGVTSTLGKPWTQSTVRVLVLSPRNAGLRSYRGEVIGAAAWPPIVPEATYRAVVARLSDPARRSGGTGKASYLLTGVALCHRCGRTVRKGQRSGSRVAYYQCPERHVSRKLEDVDRLVVAVVVGRLTRPDAVELLNDNSEETAELEKEADEVRHLIEGLDGELRSGKLTLPRWKKLNDEFSARLAELEARMARSSRSPVLAELVKAKDPVATWKLLALHEQRAVVDALVEVTLLPAGRRNTFDPRSVRITWR